MSSPGARRIIACFSAERPHPPRALCELARRTGAGVLGLFVEEDSLLRLAALPFAAEVGFPSAARRPLDVAAMERSLRAQAEQLRRALAAELDPAAIAWSFHVRRATLAGAIAAVLDETQREDRDAPALLLPPGAALQAEPNAVAYARLDRATLEALLRAPRPLLLLPE